MTIKTTWIRRPAWIFRFLALSVVIALSGKGQAQSPSLGGGLTSAVSAIKSHHEALQNQSATEKGKAAQKESSPAVPAADPSLQNVQSKSGTTLREGRST